MQQLFDKNVLLVLGLVVVLLVVSAALNYRNTQHLEQDLGWVAHTHQVLHLTGDVLRTQVDAETGVRGFVITGQAQFLEPYQSAVSQQAQRLANLQSATHDNPRQSAQVEKLAEMTREHLAALEQTMAERRHSAEAGRDSVAAAQGKARMDAIRAVISDMESGEQELLKQRRGQSELAYRTAITSGILMTSVGLAMIASFAWLLWRSLESRNRAATVIHQHRAWLQTTLQSIGDAVIATDAAAQVTFLNSVAAQLTGWKEGEAQGQPLETVFQIVNEDSRQTVPNPALRALRDGTIVGLANHTLLISRDGVERSIDDSAAPIRDEQGQVSGAVLIFRDITERRRLELENADRARASRLLAAIVESSEDAIISRTLDGTIQTWNAAAERLFGYPAADVVGRSIDLLIPAERMAEEREIVARLRTGERIAAMDTVRLRRDGQPVPVSLTTSTIRDGAGNIVGASKIIRDVSERKQAEGRIQDLLAALRMADRRKDEFLATLAHELRGPLAPLRNMLEIIKLSDGDRQVLDQARDTMERQLKQMVRLVDDLLDVSRITLNKLELRKERVELASVLYQSVEACRHLAVNANHDVRLSVPATALYVDADPVRLVQVFSNLLNNSCKYTEPGGHIRLTADREGSDVVVIVEDDGMGMPADMLHRIFDMFTQVDPTLERSHGGLGIGLTLVKSLVEMHEGQVEAFSAGLGQGSRFVVRLKMFTETPAVATPDTPPQVSPSTARRILVVDDNLDGASSLAMLLKISGHETHLAHDGLAAVEAAERLQPDIVLLDIGLPKLNGFEACRRIREQPGSSGRILVALTGWGQEEDRRKSQEAGFDYHLVKPVDFGELSALLRKLSC